MRQQVAHLLVALLKSGQHIDSKSAAVVLDANPQSVARAIRRLYNRGEVHAVAWKREPNGPFFPVVAYGPGEDVPKPILVRSKGIRIPVRRIVLDALKAGKKLSAKQASRLAATSMQSAHNLFQRLRAEGVVHVAYWRRGSRGPHKPVIAYGTGEDAPYPAPYTNSEKLKRYRGKMKRTNPAKYKAQLHKSAQRVRELRKEDPMGHDIKLNTIALRRAIRAGKAPHDPIALILLGHKP